MTSTLMLLWAGLVLGVSFVATPSKFRASSLTLPVALDVGHVTFHALNKIEWIASALTLVAAVQAPATTLTSIFLAGAMLILAAQTFVMLPRLDTRVAAIIQGQTLARSRLHTMYAISEAAKCAVLITAAAGMT